MRFSVGFILAALSISTAATPVETKLAGKGVKIPLAKRTSLQNADGTVDVERLLAHKLHTATKIQRGLANYERNVGTPHPLARRAGDVSEPSLPRRKLSKRQSEPLATDDASLWQGSISVGTPASTYSVIFDTGSADMFLPGKSCTSSSCSGHKLYDPSASSTSSDLGKTFSLTYGDGSTVSGEQYTETVAVAGLTATTQTFGVASSYSAGLASSVFPPDGLLGMGFASISDFNADPVFQTMFAQGAASEAVFGFKLASSGSSVYLGGTDSTMYTGSFSWTPVTQQGFWQVNIDSISVDGNQVAGTTDSIIDTGTTLLTGPTADVKNLYASIPGSKDASSTVGAGHWSIPCSSTSVVSLTFGGTAFDISPATFNLGAVSEGSSDCVGGLMGSDTDTYWIIGDVFLQNAYTAFDIGNARVGFAKLS